MERDDALLVSGLNQREALVYRLLLKIGESSVGELTKRLKLHSQLVYRALEVLQARGLVVTSLRRHRTMVRAEDPRILERVEEERLAAIRAGLPALLALQKNSPDAVVRVAKGSEAIRRFRFRVLDELASGESFQVLGITGERFFEVMGDAYREVEKKRLAKGITYQILSFASQKKIHQRHKVVTNGAEFRYLPESLSSPTSALIYKTTVAIHIWTADPILITIDSPEFAETYRNYFNLLWQQAKNPAVKKSG